MDKVILWELRKKFKFDRTNKWYMYNLASVLENVTNKLLWDFDIQTYHPNLDQMTRPYNNQQQKKITYRIVDFAVPTDQRVKLKEIEKKDKYLDLVRKLKKLWDIKVIFIPIVICALSTVIEGLIKGLEDFEIGG